MPAQFLSEEQKRIVSQWTHEGGPMLVQASAGSGKTRVLTESVRRLLEEAPKARFRILCVTFTNKAAEEMQARLQDAPGSKQRLFIGTLHAFALDLLHARKQELGYQEMPHIIEREADRKAVLAQAIQSTPSIAHHYDGPEKDQAKLLDNCLRFISKQKRKLVWLDEDTTEYADWSAERVSLYLNYNTYLRNQNLIDYDDILLLAWRILTEHPRVAKLYRQLYHYVLVDEAQDLSFAQYELLRALCGDQLRNVMMVGDPKQAIHGYAGAHSRFMEKRFVQDFGLTPEQQKEITLNYRSSQAVIELANQLSGNGQHQTHSYFPGKVVFRGFEDEQEEAKWVVDKLHTLIGQEGDAYEGTLTLDKVAILARNRYVFQHLRERLDEDPKLHDQYFLKRGTDTLEPASNVMRMFDLGCRLLENGHGHVYQRQFRQLLSLPSNGQHTSIATPEDLGQLLLQAQSDWLPTGLAKTLAHAWQQLHQNLNHLPRILEKLTSAFRDLPDPREQDLALQDVEEWQHFWKQYIRSVSAQGKSMADFRRFLAMGGVQRREEKGLTLATVHTVKGLEFHVVFLIGLGQGTFPDYRAVRSGNLREEANNLYVAVTRAKRDLYLSYPRCKSVPWGEIRQEPSEFLQAHFEQVRQNVPR